MGQSFKLNDEPEKLVKNQIELSHDNDFLQFTDRYYTAGNFITYRRLLKNKKHKRQNSFFLGQEIYTPSDLEETDISLDKLSEAENEITEDNSENTDPTNT